MLLMHSKSDWLLPLLGWGVTFTILSILSLVCNHKTARLPVSLNAQHARARTHFEEQQRDMVQVKELKDKTVIVPLKVLIKMSCCHGDETSEGGGGRRLLKSLTSSGSNTLSQSPWTFFKPRQLHHVHQILSALRGGR